MFSIIRTNEHLLIVLELKGNMVILHGESPKLAEGQTLIAFNENFIRHGFALKPETERSTEDRENERDRNKGGGKEGHLLHAIEDRVGART